MIKILIIEDEYAIAEMLREVIQLKDVEVCGIASTGHSAIELAIQHKPDFVLTDIRLQGDLDGLQTVMLIREHLSCEVAVMSGNMPTEIRTKIDAIKPFAIIDKPYGIYQIDHLIDRFMAAHYV